VLLFYTARFRRSHAQAPEAVRRAFAKQAHHLKQDLRHLSLRAKKYGGEQDVWQARVDRRWRLYFKIQGDHCILLDLIPHPK
jgi:plasmid maintenance system killer protein